MQITQVTSGKTDDMSVLDWVKIHCFSLELFVCLLLQPLIAVDTWWLMISDWFPWRRQPRQKITGQEASQNGSAEWNPLGGDQTILQSASRWPGICGWMFSTGNFRPKESVRCYEEPANSSVENLESTHFCEAYVLSYPYSENVHDLLFEAISHFIKHPRWISHLWFPPGSHPQPPSCHCLLATNQVDPFGHLAAFVSACPIWVRVSLHRGFYCSIERLRFNMIWYDWT